MYSYIIDCCQFGNYWVYFLNFSLIDEFNIDCDFIENLI